MKPTDGWVQEVFNRTRVATLLHVPLAFGCASTRQRPARSSSATASVSVNPGETSLQIVKARFEQADPFERLLLFAGLDHLEVPRRGQPLGRDAATRLLALLLNKPLPLERF